MRRNGLQWVGLMVLTVLLVGGCGGIIAKSTTDSGKTETLRVVSGSKWSSWDRNPTKEDDSCIMLKKESTF
jgi:hypothetical protein